MCKRDGECVSVCVSEGADEWKRVKGQAQWAGRTSARRDPLGLPGARDLFALVAPETTVNLLPCYATETR